MLATAASPKQPPQHGHSTDALAQPVEDTSISRSLLDSASVYGQDSTEHSLQQIETTRPIVDNQSSTPYASTHLD